jgi:DNA-binding SARP family transcriptional activator
VEYRILGPLELLDQGRVVAVAEGRERTLLLLLLLQRPRPVSVDAIVDALWPEDPPASAAKVTQNYVLRLRKTLGHDAVTTVSGGYALRVDDSTIDADRAYALLAAGRSALGRGDALEAEHALSEALPATGRGRWSKG